ncbi:hypothetical protein [Dokdonella ginsengisoli]|uniref:Uncharacterized protein n=1 Tax=Dokdonella ginsengisoli TaxID=363846 RepID=A0ABV9QZY7_9GAMM
MSTLHLCDVGLTPDASHALHSMLKILEGRATASWKPAPIETADVLIARSGSHPELIAEWNKRGRPIVLVADECGDSPCTPFVLRHPLRVMPLLSVLDAIAEHLRPPSSPAHETKTGWLAAESLRSLAGNGWHVAHTSSGGDVWVRDGHAYAATATLDRLRGGTLRVDRFGAAVAAPPPGLAHLPLREFGWFVGLHGPADLAPWLAREATYSLRRWPDFGRLGGSAHLIELSALVAAQPRTPAALAETSGRGADVVHRFLAASSLAGLLVVREPAALPPAPRRSAWMRLVGDLRRHLGLPA